MKLEEIRKGYEETSGTFSSTARNLSLSGIAIAWLFMTKEGSDSRPNVLIIALAVFVITLFADLLQNYALSIKWYNFYKDKREQGNKEEDEVDEPESNNKWAWRIYKAKLFTLIIGYILIVCHLFIS